MSCFPSCAPPLINGPPPFPSQCECTVALDDNGISGSSYSCTGSLSICDGLGSMYSTYCESGGADCITAVTTTAVTTTAVATTTNPATATAAAITITTATTEAAAVGSFGIYQVAAFIVGGVGVVGIAYISGCVVHGLIHHKSCSELPRHVVDVTRNILQRCISPIRNFCSSTNVPDEGREQIEMNREVTTPLNPNVYV